MCDSGWLRSQGRKAILTGAARRSGSPQLSSVIEGWWSPGVHLLQHPTALHVCAAVYDPTPDMKRGLVTVNLALPLAYSTSTVILSDCADLTSACGRF
jgi:hypothetical protein